APPRGQGEEFRDRAGRLRPDVHTLRPTGRDPAPIARGSHRKDTSTARTLRPASVTSASPGCPLRHMGPKALLLLPAYVDLVAPRRRACHRCSPRTSPAARATALLAGRFRRW